jgi:predicted amidophosphoribosyltransferase
MTSSGTFPQRLTKIDGLARPDHFYLTPADECYFLGEYTALKGFAFSATNQSMDKRATAQWRYKESAIEEAAAAFRASVNSDWLDNATLVPIPPSKSKSDALYDDRLVRMVRGIRAQPALDVRELVLQRASTVAVHDQENRPTPEQIQANYMIDQAICDPVPQVIGLFDDVLTTGAHFRAASTVLQQSFPGVRIVGLFIAAYRRPRISRILSLSGARAPRSVA